MNKRDYKLFSTLYLVFFALALPTLLFVEKGNIVILLNGYHSPFTDILFKYVTFIGDGILFVPLIIGLLFVRYSYALMGAIIAVAHGLLLSFLKKIVFSGSPRPTAFFEDTSMLHFIEGVKVHTNNSFPSGHTATAFAFCLFLTFLINKKYWGILLFALAILAGYSRIYLLQHFFIDVVFGGLIGSLVTIIVWKIFANRTSPAWLAKKLNFRK